MKLMNLPHVSYYAYFLTFKQQNEWQQLPQLMK